MLRGEIGKPLAGTVIGEIAADLTKATPAEIERRLGEVLAV